MVSDIVNKWTIVKDEGPLDSALLTLKDLRQGNEFPSRRASSRIAESAHLALTFYQ